jgi:protein O-mannosyl-transferase
MNRGSYTGLRRRQMINNSKQTILFLIIAGIAFASFIAYEPVRKNGFVDLDDGSYIKNNPNVNEGITAQSFVWAFTRFHSGNWHPLTWLSHMLDCEIYGLNPFGHHITSIIIHIVNSVLLLLVLRKMTGALWPSAFIAGVFALHPLHVESVAWAAERKDVLSGLFWMLTILAYAYYAEKPDFKRYIIVLLAFVMGLLSKPMMVTLPFALLLLDYWPLNRLNKPNHALNLKHLIKEKIPFFALSVISSAITIAAQQSGGAIATLDNLSLSYRIANMFASYTRYIGKTLWPDGLAVIYPHFYKDFPKDLLVTSILLFVLLTTFCIYAGRHKRYILTGWLWFLGTLVPVIGLVQVGSQAIADRYMYIPIVGLLIIITWSIKEFAGENRGRQTATAILALIVLCISLILTRTQAGYWKDNLTLFGHAVNVTDNNPFAETNYGHALYKAGYTSEGLMHLYNTIHINPEFFMARDTLGNLLMEEDKTNEAIECFEESIRHDSKSKSSYINLGAALSKQGNQAEAIKCINKALELDPQYEDARTKIGTALLLSGKPKEAIAEFNEGFKTSTDRMEVYVNLAIAYNQLGDKNQSMRCCEKAIKLNTENSEVLNNLAWLLATNSGTSADNIKKSIGFARNACEITHYKKADLLDTLAVTYASAGRFDEAMNMADKAIKIAIDSGNNNLAGEIEKRIKFYKAGQPYREK